MDSILDSSNNHQQQSITLSSFNIMSDNIPFEIQVEIISKLPVKSLIQFRSVSKTWKSLIDSPNFVSAHTLHQTHPQHLLVTFIHPIEQDQSYVSIVDDDVTFPQQKSCPSFPPSVNQLEVFNIIGTSHGLFCVNGENDTGLNIAVIWNPSIKKSVEVAVPHVLYKLLPKNRYEWELFFGVCPDTLVPKSVIVSHNGYRRKVEVEVFTLSSHIWRRALGSSNNVPCEWIGCKASQVVVCRSIFWLAYDCAIMDEFVILNNMIISFDLISEESTQICLPSSLSCLSDYDLSLSKLRESLVVFGYENDRYSCAVWMLEPGVENSFTRLYTITAPHAYINKVLGFRKNGAPIIAIQEDNEMNFPDKLVDFDHDLEELAVYDPELEVISKIGVDGEESSAFGYFYVETILLLGHQCDCSIISTPIEDDED